MSRFKLTYKPLGSGAILIAWPSKISEDILKDIHFFVSKIEKKGHKAILELNFVYNSLLVIYDNFKIDFEKLKLALKSIYEEKENQIEVSNSIWKIPVCYSEEFGIDLAMLSSEKKMSIDEIVKLHSNVIYTVFGIGFLPGFLYLGGLQEELHFPRKKTPRLVVPKGSVGIGRSQTGIYPQDSPGGWQLIGKTPISLFDSAKEIPCKISPGDTINFSPISKDEYYELEDLQSKGMYQLKPNP